MKKYAILVMVIFSVFGAFAPNVYADQRLVETDWDGTYTSGTVKTINLVKVTTIVSYTFQAYNYGCNTNCNMTIRMFDKDDVMIHNDSATMSNGQVKTIGQNGIWNDVKYVTIQANSNYNNAHITIVDLYEYFDTVAPPTPTGLAATPGLGQISLSWDEITTESDLAGYNLYRDGVKVNGAPISETNYIDTGLADITVYTYRIAAEDTSGNVSALSSPVTAETLAPPDTTPPAPPTGLTAAAGDAKAQLFWNANTEPDLAGYNLYRDGVKVNVSLIGATAYLNEGLTNGITYQYTVTAVDGSNNESASSSPLDVTPQEPPDTTPPDVPTGLTGTPGNGKVTLNWNANTEPDLAGYNLYREGVKVNGAPITAVSIVDIGRTNGTTYSYQLSAVDIYLNESALTAPVNVKPNVPLIASVAAGNKKVTVSWQSFPGATEYKIYRDGMEIATAGTSPYEDAGLSNQTEYTYRVTAIVGGEEGAISQLLSATPGDFIEFPGTLGGLPALLDVIKSAFSFAGMFSPYLILLFSLVLVGSLVGFIIWLFTPPKPKSTRKEAQKQQKQRREITPEEKERRNRERKLWKARYDKYELLTRQGKISERERWIKDSKIEDIKERIAARDRRRERAGAVANRTGRTPTNVPKTKGRDQRETRPGRGGRNGRK